VAEIRLGASESRPAEAVDPRPLDLALIGNCRIAALVVVGRIVWWCFPAFDSNPIFCPFATCDAIDRELRRNGRIMRYISEDDLGAPVTAFLLCNFWYIDALATIGRRDEARALFVELLACRNAFGLLSEDIHPTTGALWGNIPQTYSMAGIINSAMRLSVKWEDVWCRG
jgi:hypothetical protein